MCSSVDVVPPLYSAGGRVVEHLACPVVGEDGQDEPGAGADVAHGDPGPALGRRPPQTDLNGGAGAVV